MNTTTLTAEELQRLHQVIGEVLSEKLLSLRSKAADDTATNADRVNLNFAEEVFALARNRFSVTNNEASHMQGGDVWVERTGAHYPHIRLHGGARDEDVPPASKS
ncbi:MAG: hypothetical protein SFU91_03690 [Chloroherpetonaceae bacterium]|nr:hypothetical protein [Chloroherpetonaceae bacterium]